MLILPITISFDSTTPRSVYVHKLNNRVPLGRIDTAWDELRKGELLKLTVDVNSQLYTAFYPETLYQAEAMSKNDLASFIEKETARLSTGTHRLYQMWLGMDVPMLIMRGGVPHIPSNYMKAFLDKQLLSDNLGLRRGDVLDGVYECQVTGRLTEAKLLIQSIPISDYELTVSPSDDLTTCFTLPVWCFIKPSQEGKDDSCECQ